MALPLAQAGCVVHGVDIRGDAIAVANERALECGLSSSLTFEAADIYTFDFQKHSADLLVCCEVLEHLPDVERALDILHGFNAPYAIFSVPREPMWRALNMARLKYLGDFGNTPGHINHWGKNDFVNLISRRYEVLECKSPIPWTMLLCKKREKKIEG